MKKENVCVLIDSEENRLRALSIFRKAGEEVWGGSFLLKPFEVNIFIGFDTEDNTWMLRRSDTAELITLDELESILQSNYVVKDVHLTIEELKEQAEKLGFDLVKKKREIKVGDFGVFCDNVNSVSAHDFLKEIKGDNYICKDGVGWSKFRYLTDEEKEKIQEKW